MRRILVANWKMNTTYREAMDILDYYKSHLRKNDFIKIIICPPNVWLESVAKKLKNCHIEVGAQNIHYLEFGSITGEVSAPMVKQFASYVILGHSERKRFFHESNEAIHLKVKMAIKNNLKPIICFGEEIKEEGIDHTLAQVAKSIQGLNNKDIKNVIFAYEPVWAIGTDEVASVSHVRDMIESARERIAVVYSREVAYKIKFLYGGSINEKNIKSFINENMINGFLAGRASLDVKKFNSIYVKLTEKI